MNLPSRHIIILLILSLTALLGYQVYWLYGLYRSTIKTKEEQIEMAFQKADDTEMIERIRAQVQYKEGDLVKGDKLMIVKNCYHFVDDVEGMDYLANGDIAKLLRISHFEERYGLNFVDTLNSESPSLTYEESNKLYQGVNEDYAHIPTKKKRYEAVREDPFFNALQLKYANAITCHKSQGGQWKCVFIDNAFWQDFLVRDDLKWLYTALTRAVEKVYLVNFKEELFVS